MVVSLSVIGYIPFTLVYLYKEIERVILIDTSSYF